MSIVKTHIHGVPDLICEVLSDSTEKWDLSEKADRYLACGVREYWIIDPRDESLQVWYNSGKRKWERSQGEVLESRLLPRFSIEAQGFWE